ncbi:unnamed protein product [Staurois parvus]|uniref:Uncharacterized protein n=1 Tax=Staurois parvus TaxID=386267 RepID=A0ABN9AR32_9NEOB|nr:unnamed protein product [Staurois parvus]
MWSPTLCDSLYLVSHRPCIHYIWSPTDPAFTISDLPQYTLEIQLF